MINKDEHGKPIPCKKRKFKEKQKAINSSMAIARHNPYWAMQEPEFCGVCQAWHLNGEEKR